MLQHHDLFTLYQSFQKACTIEFYPELECIWQFDRRTQDNQLPTLSEAITELAILSEAIEADACRVLSTADFNFFVESFLKKPPYSNGKSPLTPISVSSDVDDWLLLRLNQLYDFVGNGVSFKFVAQYQQHKPFVGQRLWFCFLSTY